MQVRADTELVKVFHRGQLVKTHPRQPPGGRVTDRVPSMGPSPSWNGLGPSLPRSLGMS